MADPEGLEQEFTAQVDTRVALAYDRHIKKLEGQNADLQASLTQIQERLAQANKLQRLTEDNEVRWMKKHDEALASLTRAEAEVDALKVEKWTCFHCGFETTDHKDAAAHFGDRDDAEEFKPVCNWWRRMPPEERGQTLQDAIRDLNGERDENALYRTKIEGLEYQVEGQRSEIHSFKPFRECDTIHQVFNVYDSMEGRALLAEEQLAELRSSLTQAKEALEKYGQHRPFCVIVRCHADRCTCEFDAALAGLPTRKPKPS